MKTKIVLATLWLLITIIVANLSNNFYFAKTSDLESLANLLFLAFKTSLFSCFWVFILTQNDMIFSFLRAFFDNLAINYYLSDGKLNQEKKDVCENLMKPFFTCEICTGANFSFWIYSITHFNNFIFFDLLFMLSATTLITITTRALWQKG
jgi:hypothetical protein